MAHRRQEMKRDNAGMRPESLGQYRHLPERTRKLQRPLCGLVCRARRSTLALDGTPRLSPNRPRGIAVTGALAAVYLNVVTRRGGCDIVQLATIS
jgi:hypothetical protein